MAIDIGTGAVELVRKDFTLPGRIAIKWVRHYHSGLFNDFRSPLGPGWTSSWFPALRRGAQSWEFITPDGVSNRFIDSAQELAKGAVLRLLGACLELSLTPRGYMVTDWGSESEPVQCFIFSANAESVDMRLLSVENLEGDGVDFLWNSSGNLIGLRQRAEDRKLLIKYHPQGLISSVVLEPQNGTPIEFVRYEYDKSGRLSAVIDARGLVDRYEYNDFLRIKREILKDGAVYTYRYDEKFRCIYFSGLDGYNEKRLRYVDPANQTIVTNSYGHSSVFEHLPSGQITEEYDELGNKRKTTFDEYGRIISQTDPVGGITSYTYDHNGNRDSITDPLGNIVRFTFNSLHQAVTFIDQNGFVWSRFFDGSNRLVGFQNPLGSKWSIEYDGMGNAVAIVNPLGNTRRREFVDGLIVAETDWMGHLTRFKWNNLGKVVEKIGPMGERTSVTYDVMGYPLRVILPDGQRLQLTYDAAHNISSSTNSKGQIITFRYGSCRRLLECVDSLGRSIRFIWNKEPDRLDAVINEKGEEFAYRRDARGYVIHEKSYDGREQSFEYDGAGNCIAHTNGCGEKILFERDLCGRLERQVLPNGTTTLFDYDAIGRVVEASNPDSWVGFEYDQAGHLICERQGDEWVRNIYNAAGDIVRTSTSLGHSVDNDVDPNGRIRRLSTSAQEIIFERDAAGREIGRQLPGKIRLEQRFDAGGRLVGQHLGRTLSYSGADATKAQFTGILPGYDVFKREFRYDADGLLLLIQESQWGVSEYTYDSMERVVKAVYGQSSSEQFNYDLTDNIIVAQKGTEVDQRNYLSGDRISASDGISYIHDADGRMVVKNQIIAGLNGHWEYEWDAAGQLKKLKKPNGDVWYYKYDPFGRRVAKCGPNSDRRFLWNGNFLIQEIEDGEATAWILTQDSFSPLAQVRNGEIHSIINDNLGTPREMLDADGKIIWSAKWSAWGEQIQLRDSAFDDKLNIRFQGQYFDRESGLHYNRFRYYDPYAGRFITGDPIRLQGGANLYQYVHNPIQWIDPLALTGDPAQATHITYEGVKDGKPYVGYASMPGLGHTAEEVLKYRYPNTDHFDIAPTPFFVGDGQAGKNTARGLEQRVFEDRGGLAGTSNKQNPVGEGNANRDAYLDAADEHRKKEKEKAACTD